MSKIGYIRVSTEHQETARQEQMLNAMGMDKIFMEKQSGKNTSRPELMKMLDYIREGDELYVESISRLSRSSLTNAPKMDSTNLPCAEPVSRDSFKLTNFAPLGNFHSGVIKAKCN